MFYGYIGDARSLGDILTGLLQGRSGVLELFVNKYFLSIKVQDGLVTAFSCDFMEIDKGNINGYNLLVYCIAEMLASPEGFFAFYEEAPFEGLELSSPAGTDELMIQATIARKELDEIVDKIISPYAIFKVLDRDSPAYFLEGKNLIEAVAFSEDSIVQTLRNVKDFLLSGKVDIYEFREGELPEGPEVDYMMEGVPLRKVNLITILESLKNGRFSGIAQFYSPTYTVKLFYEKGEAFALYPVDFDLFEFLISPDSSAELSLLSLEPSLVRFFAMRYLAKPEIDTVSSNFMEISKLFLGLSKFKKNALLLISERTGDRYVVFKEGKLLLSLVESEGKFKKHETLRFEEPFFVSLFFYRDVGNIASVVYLFMVNEVLSILMKHSPTRAVSLVLKEAVRYPFLSFYEGRFHLTKNLTEEEEVQLLNFLSFLIDLSAQEVGEKKQEEELEFQLRPFKDIFRVLDVDRFLKAGSG